MIRLVCLLIGYIFGLFQTSYIYGRMNGIDIREHGSGNAGSTNALRTLGKKAGIYSLVGDCLKCVLAVLAVRLLFGNSHEELFPLLSLYGAAGCILGHNFPVYLKFHGGKGIAASVGMLIMFDWKILLIAAVVFLSLYFGTHYVSLGSVCGYLSVLIATVAFGYMGFYHMTSARILEMDVLMGALTALAIFRHRSNIVRLVHGNENKLYLNKKA